MTTKEKSYLKAARFAVNEFKHKETFPVHVFVTVDGAMKEVNLDDVILYLSELLGEVEK